MTSVRIDSGISDAYGGVNFWIYESDENFIAFWKTTEQGFEATRVPREPLMYLKDAPPPTFRLSAEVAPKFMKAMVDAITNFGIGTETEAGLRGKVDAIQEHLKDMRALVFKNNS